MTTYVVAYGGERLDRIARKIMQTERLGAVEAILDANPRLAAVASSGLIPAGTEIRIPPAFTPAPSASFTLAWE